MAMSPHLKGQNHSVNEKYFLRKKYLYSGKDCSELVRSYEFIFGHHTGLNLINYEILTFFRDLKKMTKIAGKYSKISKIKVDLPKIKFFDFRLF